MERRRRQNAMLFRAKSPTQVSEIGETGVLYSHGV